MENAERTAAPPAAGVMAVCLIVADLERSVQFYTRTLGLAFHWGEDGRACLGAGGDDLIVLEEDRSAQPARPGRGLFHVALRVPTRQDLGSLLAHLGEVRAPLHGVTDHRVSESIYLADPDGNGLEVYRDRPPATWRWIGDELDIGSDPPDLAGLRAAGGAWGGMPPGTDIGHVHLYVANVPAAEQFYRDVLGLTVMKRFGPIASFVAGDGYHHHVGLRAGDGPPLRGRVGLRWYVLRLPAAPAGGRSHAITSAADGPGVHDVRDPSGYAIRLSTRLPDSSPDLLA